MKRIILIATILCVTKLVYPQQDVRQYNYYLFDSYYLNPAYVGYNDFYALNISYDTRFSGLGDASPKTMLLSAHSKVGKGYLFDKDGTINKFFSKFGNTAIGMQALYYSFGPQYEYNIGLTYGYNLILSPNSKTKLPRKMVLAFTPRLIITGIDRNKLTDSEGLPIDNDYDYLIPALNEKMLKANFMFDVGALYQNEYSDFGLAVLNITNSKNGFDSDTLTYGETGYTLYDSVYSPKVVVDAKLKFLNIVSHENIEINFVPRTAFMYAPKSKNMEVFFDLSLNWSFYEKITSIRRNLKYELRTGLYINHRRNFTPYTLLQPYVSFDFMNYSIMYAYNFNPKVSIPGYWGGNRISVLFNISQDKTERRVSNKTYWKN